MGSPSFCRGDTGADVAKEAARHRLLATLQGPDRERLVGVDNLHPVAWQERGEIRDHRHRLSAIADRWALWPRRRRARAISWRASPARPNPTWCSTLRTMEGYGLLRLERGEHGRITPKVMHDRVERDRPFIHSRGRVEGRMRDKASGVLLPSIDYRAVAAAVSLVPY